MLVERPENGNFVITQESGEELSLEEQGCAGNSDICQFFCNTYTDRKMHDPIWPRLGDNSLEGAGARRG